MAKKEGKQSSLKLGEIKSELVESKKFDKNLGKISQFFNHLVTYGGFNIQNGVMYVWGDPSIFIPMSAFVSLFNFVEKELGGDVAHEIFYWLGRVYGKNSTLMLANKFGVSKKDIPEFINGATQDGMGLVYLKEENHFKDGMIQGLIEGTNSVFAEQYKKTFGQQKSPIDFYLLGILSGGGEPLYDTLIVAEEKECVAKGDSCCTYDLRSTKELPKFGFFDKIKLKENDLLSKCKTMTLNRKTEFKFFGKKEIEFGDGSFRLKSFYGINMPVYGLVLLNSILKEFLKNKLNVLENFLSRSFLEPIKNSLQKKELKEILSELEIFGYGRFDIKISGQKNALLSNENNPYAKDYFQIFGRSKEPIDSFICRLLEEAFKVNNRKCEVKEVSCRARGDKTCTFELKFS